MQLRETCELRSYNARNDMFASLPVLKFSAGARVKIDIYSRRDWPTVTWLTSRSPIEAPVRHFIDEDSNGALFSVQYARYVHSPLLFVVATYVLSSLYFLRGCSVTTQQKRDLRLEVTSLAAARHLELIVGRRRVHLNLSPISFYWYRHSSQSR